MSAALVWLFMGCFRVLCSCVYVWLWLRVSYLDENISQDPELPSEARLQLDHADAPAAADGVVFPSKDKLVRRVQLQHLKERGAAAKQRNA